MNPKPPPTRKTPADLLPLIDATAEDAQEAAKVSGRSSRIVWQDGQHYIVTRDMRPDRVNLCVKDGKVISAYYG